MSLVGMFDISCSVSILNVVLSLTLASSLGCQSGLVVCGPLFFVMRHDMLAHYNVVSFVRSSLFVL